METADPKQALGLGLSGAHRTGKTTVAKRIEELNGCPFITSSASAIAKELGVTVGPGMAPADRRRFQEAVLLRFTADYETAGNGLFVSDRTPLDLAAYAIADWNQHSGEEHDDWLLDYVERCLAATTRFFFMVGVVQPGIPYVSEEGKPPPSDVYQEILNTTIIGLARDPKVDCHMTVIDRAMTDNQTRVNWLSERYSERITAYQKRLLASLGCQ